MTTSATVRRRIRDRANEFLDRTSLAPQDRSALEDIVSRVDVAPEADLITIQVTIAQIAGRVEASETGGESPNPVRDPFAFVARVTKSLPPMKYALGVMALAVTAAFVFQLLRTPGDALIAISIILFFMVLVVVFRQVSLLVRNDLRVPALVFTWACVAIFVVSAILLVTSVFFRVPSPFAEIIAEIKRPWS